MLKIPTLILLCTSFFWASYAHAETIDEAMARAVKSHPSIHASRAAAEAAYQTVQEEEAALYPTATASGSFGRIYSNTTTTRGLSVSRGAGYSWFGEGSGSLSQTLYDWDATRSSIGAADFRYQSAESLSDAQVLNIALTAAQSYIQVMRAKTLLDRAQQNKSLIQGYYNRIQSAFEEGGVDKSQVSRARDILSLADNAVLQLETDMQIAQANYKEAIGDLPETDMVEPTVKASTVPETIQDAIDMAHNFNPQVRALEDDIRAADMDVSREKVSHLPTLNAEVSAFKRDQKDLVGGESEDVRGLLVANWGYSFGGAQDAAYRRALSTLRQFQNDYLALKRQIQRDVEVAWATYNLSTQRKENEKRRLAAAEETLQTYLEQYEGGQQSLLEVLSVTNARFQAQRGYFDNVYQEIGAIYNLKAVIGLPLYNHEHTDNVAAAE